MEKLGTVVYTCNFSTREARIGGSEVQGLSSAAYPVDAQTKTRDRLKNKVINTKSSGKLIKRCQSTGDYYMTVPIFWIL